MDKHTTMYRRPSDPGFLGSYDWRSTILGFLLITLSCFLATEYIAKQFRFQPALGAPVFRSLAEGCAVTVSVPSRAKVNRPSAEVTG